MSSKRSNPSSPGDGVRPLSPFIRQEKDFSDLNRFRHGVLASSVLLDGEKLANFELIVQQHVDRFQPSDGVEFGIIEELAASYWRLRRAWNIETCNLEQQIAIHPLGNGGVLGQLANSFDAMAASPAMAVMERYQTRLQLSYTRSLQTLKLIRAISPSASSSPVIAEPPPDMTPQPPPAPNDFESPGSVLSNVCGPKPSIPPPPAELANPQRRRNRRAARHCAELRYVIRLRHDSQTRSPLPKLLRRASSSRRRSIAA
jgi:hypothetical protein